MSTELKIVMFTDQVKSTPNTARRTPAEIKQVARQQDDLTTEAVREYRGRILKDTGDGHFVQFLSCADAVRCGFILQQRVQAQNDAQTNDRLKFDLHIGIDLGELVVLENGDLRGNAANLAARVCSQCPLGEVYFTEKVANELQSREADIDEAGKFELKGFKGKITLYRLVDWLGPVESTPNPFIWRSGITQAEDFFDRDREQSTIRAYLRGKQNCQIVGPRRIGKTSLLLQIERACHQWHEDAVIACLDLQDPRCFTLSGWLGQVAHRFGWSTTPTSLAQFADLVEATLGDGRRPVLCLDEFEELRHRPNQFSRDFFLTLRSCGQQGMSIVTTSRQPLSELTDPGDPTSPFYNTFPLLPLGPFAVEDAQDFVVLHRPGVAPFRPGERSGILDFARGHPLALQVACFHLLEAKEGGEMVSTALRRADDSMKAHLPTGW